MSAESKLALSGIDLPPECFRGITQTYDLIDAAKVFDRTMNGVLIDLSLAEFQKIVTTIDCTYPARGIAMDPIKFGTLTTVDCAFEFGYKPVSLPEGTPGSAAFRAKVPGSVRTVDEWVYYRPRFDGMVTEFNFNFDEFGATVGWTMEIQEV